jgi:hypothetical protein
LDIEVELALGIEVERLDVEVERPPPRRAPA